MFVIKRCVAQSGSAPDLGSGSRRSESYHTDVARIAWSPLKGEDRLISRLFFNVTLPRIGESNPRPTGCIVKQVDGVLWKYEADGSNPSTLIIDGVTEVENVPDRKSGV